jgi:hypothetical protein
MTLNYFLILVSINGCILHSQKCVGMCKSILGYYIYTNAPEKHRSLIVQYLSPQTTISPLNGHLYHEANLTQLCKYGFPDFVF